MKVIFISNFFNHHQKPLSDQLYTILKQDYMFIETIPMTEERKSMGWGNVSRPQYVQFLSDSNEDRDKLKLYITNADYIILGSVPDYVYRFCRNISKRVIHYSERPIRNTSLFYLKYLERYIRWRAKYRNSCALLCSSAYAPYDFSRFHLFKGKTYKWGYFTELIKYNINDLAMMKSNSKTVSIIWVGRFIGLKHPELAFLAAKNLEDKGYQFELNMIGTGELEYEIKELVDRYGLVNHVNMLGSMSPEKVRKHMENSDIFLFTSDHNEGWGAVLNEAMNSGCACIADSAIGSVPFLIKHNVNGFAYKNGDLNEITYYLEQLINHPQYRQEIGINAYQTICNEWNAQVAGTRVINLIRSIEKGEASPYTSGPCSVAEIISEKEMIEYMGLNDKVEPVFTHGI